jgi:hypothetical protein
VHSAHRTQTSFPSGLRRQVTHSRLARMTPCERCSVCTPVGSARAAGTAIIARAMIAPTPTKSFVKDDIRLYHFDDGEKYPND